jgi:hypothetical protein
MKPNTLLMLARLLDPTVNFEDGFFEKLLNEAKFLNSALSIKQEEREDRYE